MESQYVDVEIRNAAHVKNPNMPPVRMRLDMSIELQRERLEYLKKQVRREELESLKIIDSAAEVVEELEAPAPEAVEEAPAPEAVEEVPAKKAPAKKAAAKAKK